MGIKWLGAVLHGHLEVTSWQSERGQNPTAVVRL